MYRIDYQKILDRAHAAARQAIKSELAIRPQGTRELPCGFAWVTIEGTSPLAQHCRKMRKSETGQDPRFESEYLRLYGDKGYPRGWQFWQPGDFSGQSVRIHEIGARAFRDALAEEGIVATVGSRLD